MIVNGIDTMNITYNLQECGISKANVIDAMYSKEEKIKYKKGETEVNYTVWSGDFISQKENFIHGYLSDNHLTIYGSIPKFIYGNNFQGISKEDVTNAFDNLSHVIGADLYQGNVTRVDYASNLFMDFNPKLYYRFFGDSYKFKRIQYGTSVGWKGNKGQARYKTIEDKTAWAKDTKNKIPEAFHDKHIIRYENRLQSSNRIAHVLGMYVKPTLNDILRIENLLTIHEDWKRQFFKIQKQNNLIDYSNYMQKNYYTPQEAITCYIMSLMNEAGEESLEDFMKFIREGQKLGTGQTGYNNTSKFKKKIKELKTNWIRNNNDMINEIDEKVNMTDYMH